MGTTRSISRTQPETDAQYREAFEDLSRWIRSNRTECIPSETARELLRYDNPGTSQLIGVMASTERVALFYEPERYAITIEFGPDGLADGGPRIASFEHQRLEHWIDIMRESWAWLHPRYRWVVESKSE